MVRLQPSMIARLSLPRERKLTLRRQLGFTLIELAMVLFIVALVLAGTLIPLRTQMEVRSIADTQIGRAHV